MNLRSPDKAVENSDINRGEDALGLEAIVVVVRRQTRIMIAGLVLGIAAGMGYALTAEKLYTATARVLIDSSQRGVMKDVSPYGDVTFDSSAIESQVVVASSERLIGAVVDRLQLQYDPEVITTPTGLFTRLTRMARRLADVTAWFSDNPPLSPSEAEALRRTAMTVVAENLQVQRLRMTYALNIQYTSRSPQKAAEIANAFADGYILDQLDSRYESTRRAGTWLQDRIRELRNQTLAADLKVQDFKTQNKLISASGTLVNDQQLVQTSTQLIQARQATADAAARYARLTQILESKDLDGADDQSLSSTVIADLRERYLRASKSDRELSPRLGEEHEQVKKLRREMDNYKQLIFDELSRIAETYKSEVDIAQRKEFALASSLEKLSGIANANGDVLAELRALESEADSFRAMYQSFLQRYQEALQGQSFPITEARIITRASAPSAPSYPRKQQILLISGLIGLLIGGAAAALREFFDRGFRRSDQAEEELGLPFLGMLPKVYANADDIKQACLQYPDLSVADSVGHVLLNYVNLHPLSAFSETIRAAKVSIDSSTVGSKCRVIGIVSTYPNEGKSMISKNLASSIAQSGVPTLLIDGDLRKYSLSRAIAPSATKGLMPILNGEATIADSILWESASGLGFMPATVRDKVINSSQVLASAAFVSLISQLRHQFDYIIVDLPPIGPLVDVRAAIDVFDGMLKLVTWGDTPRNGVITTLNAQPTVKEKCIGVIFNKVDHRRIHLYDYYGSYYYGRYRNYRRYYRYYENDPSAPQPRFDAAMERIEYLFGRIRSHFSVDGWLEFRSRSWRRKTGDRGRGRPGGKEP